MAGVSRRDRLVTAAVVVAALALEVWLLVGRRAGEAAYRPPASLVVPSIEIAGADDLTQTFVPGADGLASITFHPRSSGSSPPAGDVELRLDVEGSDVPLARARVPLADLLAAPAYTWTVPRVERAAARVFTLRLAMPEARSGAGLRVAIGPPDYRWGDLRVGSRRQWGDLVFETRATQVHVIDTLRRLRRGLPWPLGTDTAVVAALLVLNLAAGAVILDLARGG
jgi:hypothetical protein